MIIYILATTDGDSGYYIQEVFDSPEKAEKARRLMPETKKAYAVITKYVVK